MAVEKLSSAAHSNAVHSAAIAADTISKADLVSPPLCPMYMAVKAAYHATMQAHRKAVSPANILCSTHDIDHLC